MLKNETIVAMDKIIHIDEMKPCDFILFTRNLINGVNIEISEKIDGQNVSFGIDQDDIFFTKTKRSNPVYDVEFYGNIEFMQPFKRFHVDMEAHSSIYDIYREPFRAINRDTVDSTIQIFAELLPSAQTNTLKYQQDKIGTGALVIFDVKINGTSVFFNEIAQPLIVALAQELSKKSDWKVYPKNVVNHSEFTLNINHLDLLEKLYEKYSDVLQSRKKADKELKLKAKGVIQSVMNNIKKQFIREMVGTRTSMLGNIKPEGMIVRDFTDGFLVKFVDKDDFTGANTEQHKFSHMIKELNRVTNKKIKHEIFGNADIVKNFAKVVEKGVDNFFVKTQEDATYTYKSVDDILQVALDDMIEEQRITLTPAQTILKMNGLLDSYRGNMRHIAEKWVLTDRGSLSSTVIAVTDSAFKRTFASIDTTRKTINSMDTNLVFIELMHFIFGSHKIDLLKTEFNLQEKL